jgi:cell division protein ZapE
MSPPVLAHYDELLAAGELSEDPAQRAILDELNRLARRLDNYHPAAGTGFLDKLFGKAPQPDPPKGLYIWGDVGRGKTMVMDLFFNKVATNHKRRSHFLDFMQAVHAGIHDARQKQRAGELWEDADPIKIVADSIARKTHVLCFDEFQVTDITDAMILGRLFDALLAAGVIVVATTNVRPDDLYRDGLNRHAFLPFIDILKARLHVVSLDSPTDYRLGRLRGREVYLTPLNKTTAAAFQQLWLDVTEVAEADPQTLTVKGRELKVPHAARGAARFTFADLCEAPLGAADYIAIAANFKTVFIEAIPVLPAAKRNEAKRFITLIDALYDCRTKLVATAEAPPEDLYPEGAHKFEFDRTISRLNEMQSSGYWYAGPSR